MVDGHSGDSCPAVETIEESRISRGAYIDRSNRVKFYEIDRYYKIDLIIAQVVFGKNMICKHKGTTLVLPFLYWIDEIIRIKMSYVFVFKYIIASLNKYSVYPDAYFSFRRCQILLWQKSLNRSSFERQTISGNHDKHSRTALSRIFVINDFIHDAFSSPSLT